MVKEFFSLDGRYGRARFLYASAVIFGLPIAAFLIYTVAVVLISIIWDFFLRPGQAEGIAGLAVLTGWFVLPLFPASKRFHDLDRPAYYYPGLLVPFINFYLLYLLLFVKGTAGANQYGPDPLGNNTKSDMESDNQGGEQPAERGET